MANQKDNLSLRKSLSLKRKMELWDMERKLKDNLPYILNTVENSAKEILKNPVPEVKTTSYKRRRAIIEAYERRKRDADEILFYIFRIRDLYTQGRYDRAIMKAFFLGQLAHKADMRLLEPDTLRGIQQLEGASKGGKGEKYGLNTIHQQWINDALELKSKKPTYSRNRIATVLNKTYLSDDEYIDFRAKQNTIYKILGNIPELKKKQSTISKKAKKPK